MLYALLLYADSTEIRLSFSTLALSIPGILAFKSSPLPSYRVSYFPLFNHEGHEEREKLQDHSFDALF